MSRIMTFDDALKSVRERLHLPDWRTLDFSAPVARVRNQFVALSRAVEREIPDLAAIKPVSVPGPAGAMRARLYVPLQAGVPPGPGLVFFHGGGFTIGDLETHDVLCRRLADASRARVLAIDYRLAPEHGFPAAHEDALAAWKWATENAETLGLDANRLGVCGDSAGGNLAAFIAQEMVRAGGPKPAFQLLLYPLVQFADIRGRKLPFKEGGLFISNSIFDYFRDSYVKDAALRMDVRVSPLFADETSFRGLPPAHIVLAGWDPLHEEGKIYAEKLQSFGVRVTMREHPDMVHGFMNLTALSDTARNAIRDAGLVAGKALGAI